jgi:N-acetylglucosaminyldiphosphoundecaprenol N-acetyl-beta-D-mannosaminyltransferase
MKCSSPDGSSAADAAHKLRTVDVWGFKLLDEPLDKIALTPRPKLLTTMSPNSYGLSTKDWEFRQALVHSDYLVLDGVYFGLAPLLLKGRRVRVNNGPSVFDHFIARLSRTGGRIFFVGSTPETLRKIEARIRREHPDIVVGTFSPPFKPSLSSEDTRNVVKAVNGFRPDIVFVGMTAPKQEKWAYANRDTLDTSLVACIGAVFDWYAGNEREIAPIWWRLHMAWLVRTLRRPSILARYASIGIFFRHLILTAIGARKST